MSFWYTPEKQRIAKGQSNFDEAGDDIRIKLLMTNTTADTEQDADVLSDITTLDEYDGSGYTEATLANQVVNLDTGNNRAEITADSPFSFGAAVAAGTRSAAGAFVYRYVDGNPANDQTVAWIDSGGFPINGGGGAFTLTPNAEGLLQVT